MTSGRESRPTRHPLTSYTVRMHTKKTITSCSEPVAELDCSVEVQMGKRGGIFIGGAVSVCLGLAGDKSLEIPRQPCAANERPGRGEEITIAPLGLFFKNLKFLTMATVDMRHVNFWHPTDFPSHMQRTASQKYCRGSALLQVPPLITRQFHSTTKPDPDFRTAAGPSSSPSLQL
jgi:hypothetical protein